MWPHCQPLETDDGYRIQAKVMPPERRSKPATVDFLRSIDHSLEISPKRDFVLRSVSAQFSSGNCFALQTSHETQEILKTEMALLFCGDVAILNWLLSISTVI